MAGPVRSSWSKKVGTVCAIAGALSGWVAAPPGTDGGNLLARVLIASLALGVTGLVLGYVVGGIIDGTKRTAQAAASARDMLREKMGDVKMPNLGRSLEAQLDELSRLHAQQKITDEEYAAGRSRILRR